MTFHRIDGPNFKQPNLVHKPARRNAELQPCTLMLACCNHDPSTVVLAHLRLTAAAGIGQKPDDWFAVFACSACHDALDGRSSTPWGFEEVLIALHRTMKIQFADQVFIPGPGK